MSNSDQSYLLECAGPEVCMLARRCLRNHPLRINQVLAKTRVCSMHQYASLGFSMLNFLLSNSTTTTINKNKNKYLNTQIQIHMRKPQLRACVRAHRRRCVAHVFLDSSQNWIGPLDHMQPPGKRNKEVLWDSWNFLQLCFYVTVPAPGLLGPSGGKKGHLNQKFKTSTRPKPSNTLLPKAVSLLFSQGDAIIQTIFSLVSGGGGSATPTPSNPPKKCKWKKRR